MFPACGVTQNATLKGVITKVRIGPTTIHVEGRE